MDRQVRWLDRPGVRWLDRQGVRWLDRQGVRQGDRQLDRQGDKEMDREMGRLTLDSMFIPMASPVVETKRM